jgi:hypothetical protein
MSAPTYYRYDGWVQTPTGEAVPGASVAVLDQPANFTSQPGSPLAAIYGAPNSNGATITGASWAAQQITFMLSATPPSDVVPGSYIATSGASPSGYNSTDESPWLVLSVLGNNVTVAALTNPGSYVSGGTIATSVLPNPLSTDGNGHYFFYTLPGIYSIQVYGETIFEQDYPDQDVGGISSGSGSVTSVGLIGDGVIFGSSVTGSPITSSGSFNLADSLLTQSANMVLAGPASGGAAGPTFRALVAADIPAEAGGSVTSVGLTLTVPSSILTESVSGSPVTSSGTLAGTIGLANQSANKVWAGPTSGGAASPTFRSLTAADLPTPSTLTFANGEQPVATLTAFTLAHTPNNIFLLGFRNDAPMIYGTDYTLSGASGTLATNIGSDTLSFWYTY